MPSNKDPNAVVNAGPGRLPAGVVPAGALIPPPGGGGGAALQAHITNTRDAHMSGAIGIPTTYPLTGEPLLASVGGPINGESVLDFIDQFKDLLPVQPDFIGFNSLSVPNSGLPDWHGLSTGAVGAFKRSSASIFSKYLYNALPSTSLTGVVYPADRGVLALYKSTDGSYFSPGTMTLMAALWLGPNPPPSGVPGASFNNAIRTGQQTNYTAANSGIDYFSLTFRLPYLQSYTSFGAPYSPYGLNFYAFQLATYSCAAIPSFSGDAGSFLLVHWRETYATTLASIQPASVTVGNLVTANCYSAVPVTSDFDNGSVATCNRRYVYLDSTPLSPTANTTTSAPVGTPSTFKLSGVSVYDNNTTPLTFNVTFAANNLFHDVFDTQTVPDGVNVPTGFGSANTPLVISFSQFGSGSLLVPYNSLRKQGIPGNYSPSNPPATTDIGEYINATLPISSPGSASAVAQLVLSYYTPFAGPVNVTDSSKYLMNSYTQPRSTTTLEYFDDEHYRYISTYAAGTSSDPIVPAGGNVYNSNTTLTANDGNLQIINDLLLYPQVDYSGASFKPAGNPNYASVHTADSANALRRYVRYFDTGIARNVGILRVRGLALSAFQTNAAYNGSETTGHATGGAIIQLKVPGLTGWLDLGRAKGDPLVGTSDFYGCLTATTTSGPDLFCSYDTTQFTGNNGSGVFLLALRVTFIKNGTGDTLSVDEIEFQHS